ncbi:MAG: DUF3891 family protein [Acidobacteriota bacterium]
MIVAETPGGELRLTTQPDHAFFAAELLSLWAADGIPVNPRREDLLFATREHDNGWREADSAPSADRESGRPVDFMGIASADRLEIWRRGTERYRSGRPYASALILQHAIQIFAGATDPAGRAFADSLAGARGELLDASGADIATLLEDYSWLNLVDILSLVACGATPKPPADGRQARFVEDATHPLRGELELEPFPLAGATTFRVPCRVIPNRCYAGDADLAGEAATARWQEFSLRVGPFGCS